MQSIRNEGQPGVSLKLHPPLLTNNVALNLIGLSEGFDAQLLQTRGGPLDLSKPFMGIENDSPFAFGAVDDDRVASGAAFDVSFWQCRSVSNWMTWQIDGDSRLLVYLARN